MGAPMTTTGARLSVLLVWVLAAIVAGVAVPLSGDLAAATGIGTLGLLVVAALVVQVLFGRAEGYLHRVSLSVLGALVIVALITAITLAATALG